jgi:hypothetical protein
VLEQQGMPFVHGGFNDHCFFIVEVRHQMIAPAQKVFDKRIAFTAKFPIYLKALKAKGAWIFCQAINIWSRFVAFSEFTFTKQAWVPLDRIQESIELQCGPIHVIGLAKMKHGGVYMRLHGKLPEYGRILDFREVPLPGLAQAHVYFEVGFGVE